MPVDVAFGSVSLEYEDVFVPGKVPLIWDRRYSTSLLTRAPRGSLGPGWTCRYDASLTYRDGQFELITPEGGAELFPNHEGGFGAGEVLRNPGAFWEIFRQGRRAVAQRWNVEGGDVWRYGFDADQPGQAWRLSSIEDVTGQAVDVAWTDAGRLESIRQRLERRELRFEYDKAGRLEKVFLQVDGERHQVAAYEYDARGRLIEARDAADIPDRFEYDAEGRLTREIVKDGGVFHYRYDKRGRCVLRTGLNHRDELRLRYLDAVRITEVVDSYGRQVTYQYLPSGQVTLEVDPLGGRRSTRFDEQGRIVSRTDATGATTTYAFDEHGNRSSVIDALGNQTTYRYDAHHQLLELTDAAGQVWRREFDSANRLVATVDPLGQRWTYAYDEEGNLAELGNPKGGRMHRHHVNGILRRVVDWSDKVAQFAFDAFGRLVERRGPLGEVTRFAYDALGNPARATLPDGAALTAVYDHAGNLIRFIDANGQVTRWRYGPCSRLIERIDPVGGKVAYVWESEGGLLKNLVNERGAIYSFFRDDAGRIVREVSFDGAQREFRYDAEGYPIAYTNANGETVAIERDALHRVIGIVLPDGSGSKFTFDAVGNLVAAENAQAVTELLRDPLGRLVRETQGEYWVESSYDAMGKLARCVTSAGHRVDHEWDANGLLKQLKVDDLHILEFERDALGQEVQRSLPGGLVMDQQFDPLGQLVEQRVAISSHASNSVQPLAQGGDIVRRSYRYDRNGQLISAWDGGLGRMDFVYDPAEQLLRVIRNRAAGEAYSYDLTGNVTSSHRLDKQPSGEILTYGAGNRLLQKGHVSYEYDAEGRRTKKIEAVDGQDAKVWSYQWDAMDRLHCVIQPNGDKWEYQYDAFARRISKSGPGIFVRYIWSRDSVIHEIIGTRPLVSWVMEPDSFVPMAKMEGNQFFSIITDRMGTPREIIGMDGTLAWKSNSTAWGLEESSLSSPPTQQLCPLRFQGQWFDSESGLSYNNFRYYDPDTCQYISQDPIGLWGALNLYNYVRNPIHWVDPFGLDASIDDNGFFAPSNEYGRGSGSGRVRIPYQGGRSRDFTLANREAGFKNGTPEGYTWHHANYNPRTGYGDMQLVRTSVHSDTPHAGGVSEFVASTGLKYDTCDAVTHVEDKGRLRGRPCRG
jgi:RHS repeat-associated protein